MLKYSTILVMNIYLEMDGVLIDKNNQLADFAEVFLQYILTHWPDSTYWLSSHCWKGRNNTLDTLIPKLRKRRTIQLVELIKPTDWDELKTDAIDFRKAFLWFDSGLFSEEKQILEHYRALECYRKVNLVHDPSQLLSEVIYLKTLG